MAGMREPSRRDAGEVYRVTSAHEGLSREQQRRTRRYLISMAIRTACFVAAVVSTGWVQWAAIAGAVVLPYLAVVAANAGRESDPFTQERFASEPDNQLPSAPLRIIEAPRED